MSESGDGRPRQQESGEPASIVREHMDLDLDLDLYLDLDLGGGSWPFDPAAIFTGPLSPFHLPHSQGLPAISFPPLLPPPPLPPSPLWIFEDMTAEISSAVACGGPKVLCGNSEITNGNTGGDDCKARQDHMSMVEENSDASYVIKERMTQALRLFKESTDQHILVQVWAPVKSGDGYVLTTSGQPFVLDPRSTNLLKYRTVSLMFLFSVDGENSEYLGLPGRVFRHRLPEWTPNVQYYTSKEYQRLHHALCYNVQGTLALPVFDPSGQSCVGVVELVMTSQKINYSREVDKVCKALQAVNLKSSEILDHPTVQILNEGRQAALAEILEILTVVCEAQKLPLAQTWVPCRHGTVLAQDGGLKMKCLSFDGSCLGLVCLSVTDGTFYVVDAHLWGFREACVEHHLQKGQGVAGRAYASRRPCFCRDVTMFCKSEYPLVHYARMFGLAGSLAICLQSTHSGDDDYILEFFLPPDCKKPLEQQALLDAISALMKQCFRSLKVTTDVELQEAISFETIDLPLNANFESKPKPFSSKNCDTHLCTSPDTSTPKSQDESHNDGNATSDSPEELLGMDRNAEKDAETCFDSNGSGISGSLPGNKNNKAPEKRRGKEEKSISFEVLQQYFSGSLKDAARSLGVCPTTMKRICRQHGILRWPSRTINKVNRSLSKLKQVIESVQGAEGAFNLTSHACPLPVDVGCAPWSVNLNGSEECKAAVGDKDSTSQSISERNDQHNELMPPQELVHEQTGLQLEPGKGYHCLKTGSSSEGSQVAPTSQGSCEGSPENETFPGNLPAPSNMNQGLGQVGDHNLPPVCPIPDAVVVDPQALLGRMLIEDSGSSKDLENLCTTAGEVCQDGRIVVPHNAPQLLAMQELRTVTIKASYKDDIIRFRFPSTFGVMTLKEEVAKRLKLEVGTFHMKYLDDDHEWVMLACDADLEECIEISISSGAHVIRLSVHDTMANLGSSCESSGD